ncbi:MAG: hypothetical protein JXR37_03910 [Kiritimatiellae bacterium]|nr:hypothetical protein [Kiritimatiellia bacterium]
MPWTSLSTNQDAAGVIAQWDSLLKTRPSKEALRAFLASLSSAETLGLAEHLCEVNQFAIVEGLILPVLNQKWGKEIPFAELADMALDRNRNVLFRTLLVDVICTASVRTTKADRDLVAGKVISLGLADEEPERFRSVVIKKLSCVLQAGVTDPANAGDEFLALVRKPTTGAQVKGSCITALRRLGDQRAIPLLIQECKLYENTSDPLVIRHALVALGKYSKAGNTEAPLDAMRQVITHTTNATVYGSGVYAASLLNEEQFLNLLPSIVNSEQCHAAQLAQRSVASAVRKHQAVVMEALASEDPETALAGVRACTLVRLPQARDSLKALLVKLPDHKALIDQAIKKATLVE